MFHIPRLRNSPPASGAGAKINFAERTQFLAAYQGKCTKNETKFEANSGLKRSRLARNVVSRDQLARGIGCGIRVNGDHTITPHSKPGAVARGFALPSFALPSREEERRGALRLPF